MARFSDLPAEVLEEIMLWLPPGSLRRFKCVSKPWYFHIRTLMNNPEFVAKHLSNVKNKSLSYPHLYFRNLLTISCPEVPKDSLEGTYLLTVASTDSVSIYDHIPCVTEVFNFLTHVLHGECFKLVSHCNGIICFYAPGGDDIIFLLNPALRELKAVPDAPFGDDYEIVGVGFGYDSRANDYKVVTIKSEDLLEPGPYKAEVYSISTNSWKEIELNVGILSFSPYEYQVVYCKGVCYWYYWYFGGKIISFDFSDEVFQSIPCPRKAPSFIEPDEPLDKSSKIAVWNESIALFFYLGLDPLLIDMWVMDSCSNGVGGSCSWARYLTIGPLVGIIQPVLFWGNEELLMENKDGELIFYHLPSKELNEHSIRMEWFSDRVVICETSLVSVLKEKSEAQLQRD